jgi:predicted metallo-beta-lactamase superfamily hydrolase
VIDRRAGTRFVHASDVQGPMSPVAAAYLARERPTLLYLSGPPAYLEAQLGKALIDRGIEQLLRIIDQTGAGSSGPPRATDAAYPERFRRLWETGRVVTAAGFLGESDSALEARRLQLWTGRRKPPAPVRPSRARGAGEGAAGRPARHDQFRPGSGG